MVTVNLHIFTVFVEVDLMNNHHIDALLPHLHCSVKSWIPASCPPVRSVATSIPTSQTRENVEDKHETTPLLDFFSSRDYISRKRAANNSLVAESLNRTAHNCTDRPHFRPTPELGANSKGFITNSSSQALLSLTFILWFLL